MADQLGPAVASEGPAVLGRGDPVVDEVKGWKADDEIAKTRVLNDFRESDGKRISHEQDWDDYSRLYYGKIRVFKGYPWLSTAFIPLTYRDVETVVPFIQDSTFTERMFIRGLGQEEQDKEEADVIGKFMDYQFTQLFNYGQSNEDKIRSMAKYGLAWEKVYARDESQPDFNKPEDVEEQAEEEGEGGTTTEETLETQGFFMDGRILRKQIYKGAWVENVSVYDMYPDHANFEKEDNWRYLIHRYGVPMSRLFGMQGKLKKEDGGGVRFKNLDDLRQSITNEANLNDKKVQRLKDQTSGAGHTDTSNDEAFQREDRMVEVMDYWTPTWLIRVVNRQIVIFNGPNPLPFKAIPFVRTQWVRDADFGYGVGLIQVLRSPQNIINVLMNQNLDNTNLSLNPQKKVRRGAAINVNQVVSRVGGIIEVNSPDDVTNDVVPSVTNEALANIGAMSNFAQEATGVLGLFRGAEPGTSRFPAAGINLLQRATGRRFSTQIKNVLRSQIRIFGMVHQINKVMVKDDQLFMIVGEKGIPEYPKVTTQMLKTVFVNFVPMTKSSNTNPEVMAQLLMELDQRWAQRPFYAGTEGEIEMARTILDLMDVNRISAVLPPPAPVAPEGEEAGLPGAAGPGSFEEAVARSRGGQQAPQSPLAAASPATAIINQPPGPTAGAGGQRTIRIPGG